MNPPAVVNCFGHNPVLQAIGMLLFVEESAISYADYDQNSSRSILWSLAGPFYYYRHKSLGISQSLVGLYRECGSVW
jgi:hypothetical protein